MTSKNSYVLKGRKTLTATNDLGSLLDRATAAALNAEVMASRLTKNMTKNTAETSVAWSQVSGAWTAVGRLALALKLNDLANDAPSDGDENDEDWMYLTKDERDTIEALRAGTCVVTHRPGSGVSPGEETQVINLPDHVFSEIDILAAAIRQCTDGVRIVVPVSNISRFPKTNIVPNRHGDKDYFLVYPRAVGN